jgi:serine/threonine protein kinase
VKAFHKLATEGGIWQTAYDHFVQEAFALSKLSHPNTLRIYDFGQSDRNGGAKFPIQVSEFMAGGTLAHLVGRGGVMSLPDVVRSMIKLAEALGEAHRLDIIHRDIKPQNILFTVAGEDREPKLADFGIAKSVTDGNMDNQAENTEVVVGFPLAMFSPSWGAPEQLCGDDPTPAVDIYSLGLVTVFALTGRAVCKSTSAQEGYELRRSAPDLVAEVLDEITVPPAIVSILQATCSFDPKDRPSSALEFSKQLRKAFDRKLHKRMSSAPGLYRDGSSKGAPSAQASLKAQGTDSTPKLAVPSESGMPEETTGEPTPPAPPPFAQTVPRVADGPAVQLSRVPASQQLGQRTCRFSEFNNDHAILQLDKTRIKVGFTPAPDSKFGRTLTIRGMNAFVALAGGRPSSAVHLEDDGELEVMDGRRTSLGTLRISFGKQEGGRQHFTLGGSRVSLSNNECRMPILIDNPSRQLSFFLYVP